MSSDLSSVKKILSSKYTAIAIIFIASIGVYLNTLPNEFVYDDRFQVLNNPWIKDIRYIPDIILTNVWAFLGGEGHFSNYYRPIMHITYMIDYHIFGLKPWGFHLTNIIFHAGVTLLVFLIASMLINQSHDLNSKFQIPNSKSKILNPKSKIPKPKFSNIKSQIPNLKSEILAPPFIAALLFAVHPIHTEAVTWIAGIPELSFTLFYLLSFYLYIYPVRDNSLNRRGSCKSIEEIAFAVIPAKAGIQKSLVLKNTGFPIKTSGMTNRDFCKNLRIKVNEKLGNKIILSVFFFFLATLCKETALTLPILLFVYDYSFRRDTLPAKAGQASSSLSPNILYHLLRRYLPYLIVSITYLILRTYALGGFAPKKVHVQLSNYEYFINVFPLFIKYLEKLLLPINMNAFYVFHPISSLFEWKGIITFTLTLGFIFLMYIFRKHKVVFLSLLWIVIPLLPVLYIPALGENTFTERYLYLSSIGFVILISTAIERIYSLKISKQVANFVIISILIILTGLYSAGTIKRNYIWRDAYSLWTDTVEKSPDSPSVHNELGNVYYEQGRFDEAIREYIITLRLKPDGVEVHYNLGSAYFAQQRFEDAAKEYMIALKLKPDSPEAHNSLGLIYFEQGMLEESIKEYMIALKLKPDYPKAHNNLGLIYFEQQRFEEALKEYMIALKLKPDYPEAHLNVGNVYFKQQRFEEAIKEYMIVIKLKPNYAKAHYNIGNAYAMQGKFDDAIKEYTIAVKFKPDYAEAHNNIGNASTALGKFEEAIKEYVIAIRLKPDYAEAHYNLGLAYLKKGLKYESEEEFKTVLKLRPDFTPAREALKLLISAN